METREPTDLLVRATGMSRRAFAREYGVGEQVLLRTSQGRFTNIPPSIVEALEEAYPDGGDVASMLLEGYGTPRLQDAYEAWRNELPVGELPTFEELRKAKGNSPAEKLAAAVGSMSKLAKILHVHDYVVRRYVAGQTRELPQGMRLAMEEAKWPHTDQLDRAQQQYLGRR